MSWGWQSDKPKMEPQHPTPGDHTSSTLTSSPDWKVPSSCIMHRAFTRGSRARTDRTCSDTEDIYPIIPPQNAFEAHAKTQIKVAYMEISVLI